MNLNLRYSERVDKDQVPGPIRELARKISRIHGPVRISSESGGVHISFPSPYVVEEEGLTEVYRNYPHGSLNADKYLGLGRFRNSRGTYNANGESAMCMKTRHPIPVDQLMAYPPVSERVGHEVKEQVRESVMDREIHLIRDQNGNLVPRGPGKCVPVTELAPGHPALTYLRSRNFTDLSRLYEYCRLSFCTEEEPESRATRTWYRKLSNGFRDTPQGRLVFFLDINGAQEGWQARILDLILPHAPDIRHFLHPDTLEWIPMEKKVGDKWVPNPAVCKDPDRWAKQYSRYKTATGARRNRLLLGLDQARTWNQINDRDLDRVGILVEGPLDGGRLGSPAMAALGSHLSDPQVRMLVQNFDRIGIVPDRGQAGVKFAESARLQLSRHMPVEVFPTPDGVEDAGACTQDQADRLKEQILDPSWARMRI